jgi:hypothetical protein
MQSRPSSTTKHPVAYKLPGVKTQSAEELDLMEAVLRNQGHRVKVAALNAAKK